MTEYYSENIQISEPQCSWSSIIRLNIIGAPHHPITFVVKVVQSTNAGDLVMSAWEIIM